MIQQSVHKVKDSTHIQSWEKTTVTTAIVKWYEPSVNLGLKLRLSRAVSHLEDSRRVNLNE